MKEGIGVYRVPGMKTWLVASVLGSSIAPRKEPSRLLGRVVNAGGAA